MTAEAFKATYEIRKFADILMPEDSAHTVLPT